VLGVGSGLGQRLDVTYTESEQGRGWANWIEIAKFTIISKMGIFRIVIVLLHWSIANRRRQKGDR
jgi:hypothetical protein